MGKRTMYCNVNSILNFFLNIFFSITMIYVSSHPILRLVLKLTIRFEVFMQLPSVPSFLHKVDLISSQSWNFNSNNIGDKILFYYQILLILKYNIFSRSNIETVHITGKEIEAKMQFWKWRENLQRMRFLN